MNTYAYRIYKNAPSNPVVGGTITAENMEAAAQAVIKSNGVKVIHEQHNGQKYHHFELRGVKVGILLYVRPEDY